MHTNISPHSGAYKYLRTWVFIFSQIYNHTVVPTNTYEVENLISHKYITTQWCTQVLTRLRIYFHRKISPHSGAYKHLRSWELNFSQIYHHTLVQSTTYQVENLFSQNYITTQWCIQKLMKLRNLFSHKYITTQCLRSWEFNFSQKYHHTVAKAGWRRAQSEFASLNFVSIGRRNEPNTWKWPWFPKAQNGRLRYQSRNGEVFWGCKSQLCSGRGKRSKIHEMTSNVSFVAVKEMSDFKFNPWMEK